MITRSHRVCVCVCVLMLGAARGSCDKHPIISQIVSEATCVYVCVCRHIYTGCIAAHAPRTPVCFRSIFINRRPGYYIHNIRQFITLSREVQQQL